LKYKVYVDGQEGTTGLEINNRLKKRNDIEILAIPSEERKNQAKRAEFINKADIVFLCLPDDAAREAVSLVKNPDVRIIDASTAHRTADGWAYGIPELSPKHKEEIRPAKKVSVPGCFATGFVMLMYPLVARGIIPKDYPAVCHAVTGYSGRGKKWIDMFESSDGAVLSSPCFYALGLSHKHLPEMRKHSGLSQPPVFTPVIANFYKGMTVVCPLLPRFMEKKLNASEISRFFAEYYKNQTFVKILPFNIEAEFEYGFLNAVSCNDTNNIEIMVFGGDDGILAAARLDNLGKGSSGAAVQNMNIMLGLDEESGL